MSRRVYDSPLALAVALYNRADHVPERTCLGCGSGTHRLADGHEVWIDCNPRGVRITGLGYPLAFTWRQVNAAIPKQDGLGL